MSVRADRAGRGNQKLRTRKDLLDAAARLIERGVKPSLEEVAEEAMVSRATAYRYFPSAEALMLEVAVHVGVPEPADLFRDFADKDPTARLLKVDQLLHDTVLANETPLRLMLAHSLEQGVRSGSDLPARQNRRTGLIDAALAPAEEQFDPKLRASLGHAVAMLVGTEGLIAAKDVLRIDEAEARRAKQWAIGVLVEAARRRSKPGSDQP